MQIAVTKKIRFHILCFTFFVLYSNAFLTQTGRQLVRNKPNFDFIASSKSIRLNVVAEAGALSQYAPAAASLFNNMKTPASIIAAGLISIGFVAMFPELPKNNPNFTEDMRKRVRSLKRIHIVISMIAFSSELLAVMWATVAVNQLTETVVQPAYSVWDLLQRDCDLAWAATNCHFVLGMFGFVIMVGIRGYVMLVAEQTTQILINAAVTGMGSAFCLMISVVNRGVESGGGEGVGYGQSIFALFGHYIVLLSKRAIDPVSWGPLELCSIGLEVSSVVFILLAILNREDQNEVIWEDKNEVLSEKLLNKMNGKDNILNGLVSTEMDMDDSVEVRYFEVSNNRTQVSTSMDIDDAMEAKYFKLSKNETQV